MVGRRSLTVQTAIQTPLRIHQGEDLIDLVLDSSNTPWILALNDIDQRVRQGEVLLLLQLASTHQVHRDLRIDVSEGVQVKVDMLVNFDDVLASVLTRIDILDDRDGAVEVGKPEKILASHGVAGTNVVDDNSVLNTVNIHYATSRSSSFKISAIRMIMPFLTWRK